MTRCKQCQLDGHHKMSCTDESNPTRKDRVTVPTSLKEPIVEGAYYERDDGQVFGPAARELCDGFYFWRVGPCLFTGDGGSAGLKNGQRLTRRVYLVPTDPAEVVAELRERSSEANRLSAFGYGDAPSYHTGRDNAYERAADLVAQKLGVES